MKRPQLTTVTLLALTYMVGIALGATRLLSAPACARVAFVALLCWAAAARMRLATRHVAPYLVVLLAGVAVCVAALTGVEQSLLARAAASHGFAEARGYAVRDPQDRAIGYSFLMRVRRLRTEGESYAVDELVEVRCAAPAAAAGPDGGAAGKRRRAWRPVMGQGVQVSGRLYQPKKRSDSFDYGAYLRFHRIGAQLGAVGPVSARGDMDSAFLKLVAFVRAKIKRATYQHLSGDQAGLTLGILMGDTSGISTELEDSFRATGLTHILAVSGLNVSWLLGSVGFFLLSLRLRTPARILLLAFVTVFYAFVTLTQPSVLRAAVMALIPMLGRALRREADLPSTLSAAALALLIYDPLMLFDIGFQLSFGATAALVWISPHVQDRLDLPGRWTSELAVPISAQIGVAPILAYYYGQVSLISIAANVTVVTATAPVLTLGVVGALLGQLSWLVAEPLYWPIRVLLAYVIGMAAWLASWPWAALYSSWSGAGMVVASYGLLAAAGLLAAWFKVKVGLREAAILFLVGGVIATWSQLFVGRAPGDLSVAFLDVGEGDACLIRSAGGADILIDGGPDVDALRRRLSWAGVRTVDIAVLTHPHADHMGGLTWLVRQGRVGRLVLAGAGSGHGGSGPPLFGRDRALYEELMEAADVADTRISRVARGACLKEGRLRLAVLWPAGAATSSDRGSAGDNAAAGDVTSAKEGAVQGETEMGVNDGSVVLKLAYGRFSVLLPGDVEQPAQQALVRNGRAALESAVLKLPHHGSNRLTGEFVRAVGPTAAVVSVGAGNSYGHPSRKALRLAGAAVGTRLYRTDLRGTVTVTSDGMSFMVSTDK